MLENSHAAAAATLVAAWVQTELHTGRTSPDQAAIGRQYFHFLEVVRSSRPARQEATDVMVEDLDTRMQIVLRALLDHFPHLVDALDNATRPFIFGDASRNASDAAHELRRFIRTPPPSPPSDQDS